MTEVWSRLRGRDPHGRALRRAARAAAVVPVNFAIGSQLIGNAQTATFAAFGSFALLLFAEFPGHRLSRLAAYLLLAVAGAFFITLGTLIATPSWLAVSAMAVVAFAVLFAGVVSSVISAAAQAALLTFILPVMLPGTTGDIPERLAGWGIACVISIPVAVFVWPPNEQDSLRAAAGSLCRALSAMLHLEPPPPGGGDRLVAVYTSLATLRSAFRMSASRPVALSMGSRLLMRLVDELEWLSTAVTNACADAPDQWPEQGRRLRASAAQVLQACGDVLAGTGSRDALAAGIAALADARQAVSDETVAELRASASHGGGSALTSGVADGASPGEFDRPLYAAHELGYTVDLAAHTVIGIGAADARSWIARLLGRRPDVAEAGAVAVVSSLAAGNLDRHSVTLQNSLRAGAGLALAVLFARLSGAQQGFWIVLGALSVLRSNALSTGATVVRALAGTLAGFVIGALVVTLVGTNHAVLWPLLPVVILVAAGAPRVVSFTIGQAAFTVFTIILFNLIAPLGWQIGVVRVEDVALGCLAGLLAGALFWPRGAAAALGAALEDAFRSGADYLRQAMDHVVGRRVNAPDAGGSALAAGYRLDDALRQYLAERGAKHMDPQSVTALANGAIRLRLAGVAVSRLRAPDALDLNSADDRLAAPSQVLGDRAAEVTSWYAALADGFSGRDGPLPPLDDDRAQQSFLDVVLPAVDGCGDPDRAARAESLLWSGQYLGDVSQVRADLVDPAARLRAARLLPWWQR